MLNDDLSADPSLPDSGAENDPELDEKDLSTPQAIFTACRRRIERFLAERIDGLFTHAHDDLFAVARDAASDSAEQESIDAMQELHRVKAAVSTGFVAHAVEALDRLWSEVARSPTGQSSSVDYEHMSLVDTQSLDDEVQLARILTRASPALRASETALEHQLSHVLPTPVDSGNNPVSARNLCSAFLEAVQNLGAEKPTRRALFRALDATVVADLGALQRDISDLLSAQGIPPEPLPHRTRQGARDRARSSTPRAPSGPEASGATGEPVSAPPVAHQTLPRLQGQVLPWTAAPDSTLEVPFASACASAQHLMRLERTLVLPIGAAPSTQLSTTAETEDRLLVEEALARIQRSGVADSWGEKGPYAFGARVRAALAEQGITLDDLPDADALDIVSNLLDNLLADPLIQANAKLQIRRLGLPLGRIALTDATFLASDSHPGRQTINRLGRLAVPDRGDEKDAPFTAAEVHRVVDNVLVAPRADRDVFASAANELAALLERQNACFEQGVARLVEARERQQAEIDKRRGHRSGANADKVPLSAAEAAHKGWQETLERVSRLELGDVLILTADQPVPAAATLVWRSRADRVLVFADALGRQAASFARRGLAMALFRGSARIDEAARMPIVDRAMCGVLEDLHGKLERKASRDPLTGLANGKRFELELARAIKSARSSQQYQHVCFLGVENLSTIATRFGERAGEILLARYAPVLERQLSDQAVVAHLGDGHFAALLKNASRTHVLQLMERHRRSIELAECRYKGETIDLAVSIGVVAITPETDDPTAVLEMAKKAYDKAMSSAPMGLHIQAVPAGEGAGNVGLDVTELIAQERLTLRCQRIEPVDPDKGLQPYYEVLLGVRGADGRVSPPGEVIVAAERTGKVAELDRWVVAKALRWMAANDGKLAALKGLAINLSGGTLSDPKLAGFVAEEIESSGVAPERIMFEVTESATIERLPVAREFIDSIRALGCRFAIDDFGSGHASFSYLKLLPVDTVKIDGMFVKDIVTSPADEAMVRSINEVAKLLGKCTVAEFVADDRILHRLRELGVDYGQGYGIEKPMLIDDLAERVSVTDPASSVEADHPHEPAGAPVVSSAGYSLVPA